MTHPSLFAVPVCLKEIAALCLVIVVAVQTLQRSLRCLLAWPIHFELQLHLEICEKHVLYVFRIGFSCLEVVQWTLQAER